MKSNRKVVKYFEYKNRMHAVGEDVVIYISFVGTNKHM